MKNLRKMSCVVVYFFFLFSLCWSWNRIVTLSPSVLIVKIKKNVYVCFSLLLIFLLLPLSLFVRIFGFCLFLFWSCLTKNSIANWIKPKWILHKNMTYMCNTCDNYIVAFCISYNKYGYFVSVVLPFFCTIWSFSIPLIANFTALNSLYVCIYSG